METISSGNIDQLFDSPPEYSSIVTWTSQQGANTSSQPNNLVPEQTGIRIIGLCKLPTYDEAMKITEASEKNEQECVEITSTSGETSSPTVMDNDESNTN